MAVDLTERAGLPFTLTEDGRLVFGESVSASPVATRKLAELRPVLEDPDAAGPDEVYFMYRDVSLPEDTERLHAQGLRYDLTVVRPGVLGREYVKTAGHYHPLAEDGTPYPEIYEVLYGVAHYLLQRREGDRVVDVVLVEAHPGDQVLIPPGYGHITINPGDDWLVMDNLVAGAFSSEYGPYASMRGGAYYERVGGELVPNPRYSGLPAPRRVRARPVLGLDGKTPLYVLWRQGVDFSWLVRPARQAPAMKAAVEG